MARSVFDRFHSNCVAVEPSGCWIWTGHSNGAGYGLMKIGSMKDGSRRNILAHRLSWELHRGPIPDNTFVCHHCDVRFCVNPAHLFLGSQTANMRDCKKKKRNAYGETHGRRRLSETDVRRILFLCSHKTHEEIAAEFGLHVNSVQRIKAGRRWGHLTDAR